jgi:hypothetical protein
MNHLLKENFKPLKITLGSFQFFSKICGDICQLRCTIRINNSSGKLANGVNKTGGKFATKVTTQVANSNDKIMGTISDYLHLEMDFKKKFIYMLTLQYYPKVSKQNI